MADKQISELTRLPVLDSGGLFAVQQDGAAYRATAAQIAALSGGGGSSGGGGGDSTVTFDLTGQVEVDSDPRSADDKRQGFDLDIDVEALVAAPGPVRIVYTDIRLDDQRNSATFTQKVVDDTAAADGDSVMFLYAPVLNPWWGVAAAFELEVKIAGDGYSARLVYWPFAQEQADFKETDSWLPGYVKNSPITVKDGYTYLNNTPKPTAFNWTDLTCSVPMDDGSTHSIAIVTDSSGAVTGITIDGSTVPITGV